MKRRDVWRAILAARSDVDRMVASAVGDYPDAAPVRPSTGTGTITTTTTAVPFQMPTWRDPGGAPSSVTQLPYATSEPAAQDSNASSSSRSAVVTEEERRVLADLNRRVRERVVELGKALAQEAGCDDAIKALVIYLDERIMTRLPDYLSLSWPLLQIAYTRSTTGGDDFYRFAGELRAQPSTPSFVFEVYYFCLENGFVGRYANDLVAIERYQQWLREAIDLPRVSNETTDTAETSTHVVKPVPAWMAYAISLGAVVLVTATMTLLSNY